MGYQSSLENGSDQLIVTLYTLHFYSFVHTISWGTHCSKAILNAKMRNIYLGWQDLTGWATLLLLLWLKIIKRKEEKNSSLFLKIKFSIYFIKCIFISVCYYLVFLSMIMNGEGGVLKITVDLIIVISKKLENFGGYLSSEKDHSYWAPPYLNITKETSSW